jgi:hypothetical protein
MQRQMAIGAAQAALLPSLAWLTLSQVPNPNPDPNLTLTRLWRGSHSLALALALALALTPTRCTVAPPY